MPEFFFTDIVARHYNIMDWYWLADDGRVFASARQLITDASDPGYLTFIEGGPATTWPRDDAGQQTNAALQMVIDDANIVVGGVPIGRGGIKVG
jgi:hypothetical protein